MEETKPRPGLLCTSPLSQLTGARPEHRWKGLSPAADTKVQPGLVAHTCHPGTLENSDCFSQPTQLSNLAQACLKVRKDYGCSW